MTPKTTSQIERGLGQSPDNVHAIPFYPLYLDGSQSEDNLESKKIQAFPSNSVKECSVNIAIRHITWLASIILLLFSWHWISLMFWQSSNMISVYYFLHASFWGAPGPLETNTFRSDNITCEYSLNGL